MPEISLRSRIETAVGASLRIFNFTVVQLYSTTTVLSVKNFATETRRKNRVHGEKLCLGDTEKEQSSW